MIIETFYSNGDLIIVTDEATIEDLDSFEIDFYDEYDTEYETEIPSEDILEYIAEQLNIYIYKEGDPEIEKHRIEKAGIKLKDDNYGTAD